MNSSIPPQPGTPYSVSLIGMAGVGKSTIGGFLAQALGWAQVDTDSLIEAYFGAPLQDVFNSLGYDAFLEAEERLVAELRITRCVISTGGSVVYGASAVERLKKLGPVVFLQASYPLIQSRVQPQSHRGLAIRPGQTLQSLYDERQPLYHAAADLTVSVDDLHPQDCVSRILDWLGGGGV